MPFMPGVTNKPFLLNGIMLSVVMLNDVALARLEKNFPCPHWGKK
jgi:hypothetical protein